MQRKEEGTILDMTEVKTVEPIREAEWLYESAFIHKERPIHVVNNLIVFWTGLMMRTWSKTDNWPSRWQYISAAVYQHAMGVSAELSKALQDLVVEMNVSVTTRRTIIKYYLLSSLPA